MGLDPGLRSCRNLEIMEKSNKCLQSGEKYVMMVPIEMTEITDVIMEDEMWTIDIRS